MGDKAQDLYTQTVTGYGVIPWHHNANNADSVASVYPHSIPEERIRELFDAHNVVKCALSAEHPSLGAVNFGDQVAIMRESDAHFYSTSGPDYQPHQYSETLLDGMESLVGGGIGRESAGTLKNGSRAYLSVSLADSATSATGLDFRTSFLGITSHDQSYATTYKLVKTLVVCSNTLHLASTEAGPQVKRKHTKDSRAWFAELPTHQKVLGLLSEEADAFEAEMIKFANITVTDSDFHDLVKMYVPITEESVNATKDRVLFDADGNEITVKGKRATGITRAENKREAITEIYNTHPYMLSLRGTGLGWIQAVNTFNQHVSTVKGEKDFGAQVRFERNFADVVSGAQEKDDTHAITVLKAVLSLKDSLASATAAPVTRGRSKAVATV